MKRLFQYSIIPILLYSALITPHSAFAQYPIRNYVSLQDNTTHMYGAGGGFLIKQLLPNGTGTRFTSFAAYRDSSIFYIAGSEKFRITGSALTASDEILPGASATYDLGATGTRWRDLWLSRNATVGGALGVTGATTIGAFAGLAGTVNIKGNAHIEATGNTNQLRLTHDGTDAFVNASSGNLRLQLANSTRFQITPNTISGLVSELLVNNSADATTMLRIRSGLTSAQNAILIFNDRGTDYFSFQKQSGQNFLLFDHVNSQTRLNFSAGANSSITYRALGTGEHEWYAGGSLAMLLSSAGNLTTTGNFTVNGTSISIPSTSTQTLLSMGEHHIRRTDNLTFDINPARDLRLFRLTNNASANFYIMKGDGSATTMASISANTGNITTSGDLAANGGDITTTATDLRLHAGGGGVLRFLGDAVTSEMLAENNHSRWGNRRDDATQESIDLGVYTNGTTWNSRLLLSSTGGTIAGDLGVNGGDMTSSATTFNLLNSTVQTLNLGGASTATTIGATTGSTTVRNHTYIGNQKNFGSSSFTSGFTGAGWQSYYKDAEYWFETDNLNIRGTLSAYDLLIQQIRATNGSIYIASVQKVDTVIDATAGAEIVDMEDPGDHDVAYFAAGDIVLTQRVRIDDPTVYVKRIVRKVASTLGKRVTFTAATGGPASTGVIEAGDEFVRVGSETDAARRGSVYLTADDTETPYMDVVDDVASWADFRSIAKNKVRLGKLTGVTDADFGGALTGYGLYTTQGYFKGNIHVKSDVPQALQNSAIQIGNITGTANSAIKITNTGTASTSGFFAYSSSGNQLFKLALDNTAQIAGAYFSNANIWAGNSDYFNAGNVFIAGGFTTTPKIVLGADASNISVLGPQPGFIVQSDGQLKIYLDANNYIRRTTGALDIAASNFELASGNLGLSGNTTSSYIKIGTLADATTTATTNSGFRADNNGNVLIKGNVSGSDYVKITGGGGIDINASVFKLLAGNSGGYLGIQSGTGTTKTFFSGATASDGTGANFYVQANGYLYADSGAIAGWDFTPSTFSKNNTTLSSSGYLSLGSGDDIARLDAQDATYRLWIGDATAADAPFRVTKAGAVTTTNATIVGVFSSNASGSRVTIDGSTIYVFDSGSGQGTILQDLTNGLFLSSHKVTLDGASGGVALFGNSLTFNSELVWNTGNDGSGSGLDADLLDGNQASEFIRANAFAKTKLSSDFSTTNTTATNVTGMSFSIAANEVWNFDFVLRGGSSDANGLRWAITVPSGATLHAQAFAMGSSSANFSTQLINASGTLTTAVLGTTTTGLVRITGVVVNGANAGSIQLQTAKNISGTATVYANSFVTAQKM